MVRILGKEYEAEAIPVGLGLKITFSNPTTEMFIEIARMDFDDAEIEIFYAETVIGVYKHQKLVSVTKYDDSMVAVTDGKTNEEVEIDELKKENDALWEAMNLLTDDIIPSLF